MSKKIALKFIIAGMILFLALSAGYALAQAVTLAPPILKDPSDPSAGGMELKDIIGKIAGVIFWLALMICPIAIVWGGFEIATAGGDQGKITKGKQIIQYSIVGLAIIALSAVLVEAIKSVLG